MSKYIKMPPECIEQCKQEFAEALATGKFSNGRINFSKNLGTIERKATVVFSEKAWIKMHTLIREFDKEVAWHCVAFRGEDPDIDEYHITDVLVYPQKVSGVTVETDQVEYQNWLFMHDDEVFNNIRAQMHSHVNMSTTPSAVDTTLYDSILAQLEDDMFYIFMIWNKRKDKHVQIYDMKKNVLFETSDVTIAVQEDDTGMEKFIKDAKSMVKEMPRTPAVYGGYNNGYNGYNTGYGRQKYGGYRTPAAQSKKEDSQLGKTTALTHQDTKKNAKISGKGKGTRKGKRTKKNVKSNKSNVNLDVRENYCMGATGFEGYDDFDDYYKHTYGHGYWK